MIINGIDLSAVPEVHSGPTFPPTVPGRTVHIDADFLAYHVSYERKGEQVEFATMQHNAQVQVEKFRKFAGAEKVHLHLTPSTSTKGDRPALAIQKEYQSSRKEDKPEKLHIVREWMGRHFPATLWQIAEADDGMAQAAWAANKAGTPELCVILSKDKDLRMVPGLHLDWENLTFEQPVSETGKPNTFGFTYLDTSKSSSKVGGYGTKFFWSQMLTGDPVDTIQGLPLYCSKHLSKPKRVGPVLAECLLSDVWNDKQAFDLIKTCYEATGREVGFKHWKTGDTVPWQHVMVSEMQLLWMRRNPEDKNDVLAWLKEYAV